MTPWHPAHNVELYHGDSREVLAALPDGSVHCVVCSPPYWGLRDYQVKGQLGLEETPDAYIANMVEVFREVRRVLRGDGVAWVNMGDGYAGNSPGGTQGQSGGRADRTFTAERCMPKIGGGLKPKDLLGMPWRLAFALQADGWWLRSDVIWAKPSPMPESVTDRPTKAHEYVFLLTKAARYYYDADAVREVAEYGRREVDGFRSVAQEGRRMTVGTVRGANPETGRNLRTVWTINSQPFDLECCRACLAVYDGRAYKRLAKTDEDPPKRICGQCDGTDWASHFATFPEKLVEPCVKAGTSEKGACPKCGAGWVRVTESTRHPTRPGINSRVNRASDNINSPYDKQGGMIVGNRDPRRHTTQYQTIGWQPGCKCDQREYRLSPGIPCTVLDPFAGSSTVGVACQRLGRKFVGIELSETSLAMSRYRLSVLQGEPTAIERDAGQAVLFDEVTP